MIKRSARNDIVSILVCLVFGLVPCKRYFSFVISVFGTINAYFFASCFCHIFHNSQVSVDFGRRWQRDNIKVTASPTSHIILHPRVTETNERGFILPSSLDWVLILDLSVLDGQMAGVAISASLLPPAGGC